MDEMAGGSFTISNGGVYGSLLSTPIINPPQSAIPGMHSIVKRPMVVGGNIVARPMMYKALTYDHRLIDGREAVYFLRRGRGSKEVAFGYMNGKPSYGFDYIILPGTRYSELEYNNFENNFCLRSQNIKRNPIPATYLQLKYETNVSFKNMTNKS